MYLTRGLGDSGSVAGLIQQAAQTYGVPPSLALAVATRESGLNQAARGSSGEIGVFQLMPGTASDLGVNPSDLSQNVDGGVRYLAQLYRQFGDWGTALQAYNGGPGNVQRGTVSFAARDYAAAVLAAAGLSPDLAGSSVLAIRDLPAQIEAATGLSGPALLGMALVAAGLVVWAAA